MLRCEPWPHGFTKGTDVFALQQHGYLLKDSSVADLFYSMWVSFRGKVKLFVSAFSFSMFDSTVRYSFLFFSNFLIVKQ